MGPHVEIIKLVIAYALTGSFLFTLVVTCLSLVNVIKSIDKKLKRKLINVLIVEVAVIAIGSFSDLINLDPGRATTVVRNEGIKDGREREKIDIADRLIRDIAPEGNLSKLNINSPASRAQVLNTLSILKEISPEKAGPNADSLIDYINRAPTSFATSADSVNFMKNVATRFSDLKIGLKTQGPK
jgi:hypothetical protein